MNYQFKASLWSFAVHLMVFMIIIGISHSVAVISKPIMIDFSMGDLSAPAKGETGARKRGTTAPPQKQKRIVKMTEKRIRKPPPARIEEQKIKPKTAPLQESPIAPSLSESQAPVPAPMSKETTSLPEPEDRGMENVSDPGNKGNISGSLHGSAAGSAEGARTRYLKEHFAYIRNMIVKNLSYPLMARKMGWEGKLIVSFVVCESGRVEEIRVKEGSGFGILDKNAVETIKRVSPFPKPPVKAEIVMPIAYRLE